MMASKFLKYSVLALSVSALLTGCGGGGGSSSNPEPTTTVNGRAVDGPLAGATVVFKDCADQTTVTNATGHFNFPENCLESEITISGGIDTATDLPFAGQLKAPSKPAVAGQENNVFVSPITTLIAAAPSEAAKTALISALGLEGKDLLSIDPMTDKDVYAKSVAVQQVVEQIQQSVSSLGGTTSQADLNQAAVAALTSALASGTTELSSPEVIKAAVVSTVTAIQEDLPPSLKENASNVAANLGSLTANVISANVKAVETQIAAVPATAFNGSVETVKEQTKDVVTAAKEAVTVAQVVTTLAPALTATPTDVATSLEAISEKVATTNANETVDLSTPAITEAIANIEAKAEVTIDTTQLENVNKFYADYLELNGFNVQGTDFTITQLNGSLGQPLSVSNLNSLLLNVAAVGAHKANSVNVGAALELSTEGKQLSISANTLNLAFNEQGVLTVASIPAQTNVTVKSTLSSVANTTFTTSTAVNALVDGKIALNTATLGNLSASLAGQLTGLQNNLKGKTVTVTAVLAGNPHIAISNKALATKYTVNTTAGSGVSAKFNVQ